MIIMIINIHRVFGGFITLFTAMVITITTIPICIITTITTTAMEQVYTLPITGGGLQ